MRNFIAALPSELFQAARAEGASPAQILWHVVLPLMRPALAALAILMFTFVWNDYFWSVVLTQSDAVKPVTAGLNNLRGQWTTAWNLVAAGTLFIAIPPVVMFFAMQRHFIAGLTMGAHGAKNGGGAQMHRPRLSRADGSLHQASMRTFGSRSQCRAGATWVN